MNPIISGYIQFHEKDIKDFPLEIFEDMGDESSELDNLCVSTKFGIVNLKTEKTNLINKKMAILFSLDNSASMSDDCIDGRTKIKHATHTIVNILRLFAETKNIECMVGMIVFNRDVTQLFDFIEIKPGKLLDETIQKIENVYPVSCTNIEESLVNAKNVLDEYKKNNPSHKIVHIQLTDGDATEGESIPDILKEKISDEYINIFVGFGSEHNSILLQKLASRKRGEYVFVDKIENAGLVYGEIIHNLLYPAFEEGYIEINNGEIYDWTNNIWVNRLEIPSISSDNSKIYHIRSTNPDETSCKLYGITATSIDNSIKLLDDIAQLPSLISTENGEDEYLLNDFTEYMYRQKVQEILYKINHLNYESIELINTTQVDPFNTPRKNHRKMNDSNEEKKMTMRNIVKTLFQSMNGYKKGLENMVFPDEKKMKFVKVLMDDIYIAYKTIGLKKSHMYSCARQRSQGRQCTYNVTNIEDDLADGSRELSTPSRLKRSYTLFDRSLSNNPYDHEFVFGHDTGLNTKIDPLDINIDEDQFELSQNTETSYATPTILKLMRSVSGK
jgi:Mg-chelatase subunit ChlD